MPYMLQPHQYAQIARPNLYNVAYRRVGAYKGMGRLHPTNYLEIGPRPNRIGNTTGQYNTLSGQLSLFPPSLRGLGQDTASGPTIADLWNLQTSGPYTVSSALGPPASQTTASMPYSGPYLSNPMATAAALQPQPGPLTTSAQAKTWLSQYGVYVAVGVGMLALLMAGGRR